MKEFNLKITSDQALFFFGVFCTSYYVATNKHISKEYAYKAMNAVYKLCSDEEKKVCIDMRDAIIENAKLLNTKFDKLEDEINDILM